MDDARLTDAESLLGYRFSDRELLRTALTHPSYAAEHDAGDSYDRLEFLGDAVLGFIVADHVYTECPSEPEGELTRRKHFAVSGDALTDVAVTLGLADFVLLGVGAHAAGDRQRASVLENTVEALIGAIYLDGGLEEARSFVVRGLGDRLTAAEVPDVDAKGALQQWSQGHKGVLPSYRIVEVTGPIHARTFTAEVEVAGTLLGSGSGVSKRAAEKAAALVALDVLRGRRQAPGDS